MTNRSHLNTSLPLQTSLQHAARDCFTALEHRIASLVGDEPLSADHADRNELLEQKHVLSSQMEELRATMRNVQEDGEHCSDQARQFEAEGALDLIKVAAQRDKLQTLREQLQRSRQQAVEHRRAERELRAEIERAKATFHEVISVELEVQPILRSEQFRMAQEACAAGQLSATRSASCGKWCRILQLELRPRWMKSLAWSKPTNGQLRRCPALRSAGVRRASNGGACCGAARPRCSCRWNRAPRQGRAIRKKPTP
ncbi:unnamed protein product [Effrenium voratum]|nr:unnamed protein product [Effrenium voratum]